ncbi:F-box only protein 34 isoform X1 [Lepisosteus oculatus]|uniref:F-box only protein 34 isoform X1 n=2 Tax=Lepisosteus oculatus TaxID=7918 RepID=UPI0037150903
MSSRRAAPYREQRKPVAPSTLHPAWRFAVMHLKPYPKFQKKELTLETSQDNLRGLLSSQQGAPRTDRRANTRSTHQPCSPGGAPSNGTSCRRSFGVQAARAFCSSPSSSFGADTPCFRGKSSKVLSANTTEPLLLVSSTSEPDSSLTFHQVEEGDGPLDIWAVIKPGNTKEKIAIFAAHQCSNTSSSSSSSSNVTISNGSSSRTASMKIKGSWDVEGSVAKRRKRSADPDKSKATEQQLPSRTRDCGAKQMPVAAVSCLPSKDGGEQSYRVINLTEGSNMEEGEDGGKALSVVEMVAYLEQRANALHMDCTKYSSGRSSGSIAPSKGGLMTEKQGSSAADDQRSPEEMQGECVRVLEMVAKLESECLKRQCEREAGGLSRSNSLRRNVGRVLLTSGESSPASTQQETGHKPSPTCQEPLSKNHNLAECPSNPLANNSGKNISRPDHCEGAPFETIVTIYREKGYGTNSSELTTIDNRVQSSLDTNDPVKQEQQEGACAAELSFVKVVDPCIEPGLQPETRMESEPHVSYREEPLPGMLFFKQSSAPAAQNLPSHSAQEILQQPKDSQTTATSSDSRRDQPGPEEVSNAREEGEGSCVGQDRLPFPLRRLVSHEFLEARFKIQQLLEPQQYMAFLPHHIMVKIFCFLPTETLAALKCTCQYFKFIIESYDVRPADSRWVRDPRYKDDPCKQCKKRYGRGDVSLCRWHHKPYCQALPYGPGYWMCCHGSQKDTPGCNVGLHDNRWVPAFHSINMPIYKKVRDTEEET